MNAATKTRLIAAGPEAASEAARCLGAGGLVAFPTETVYGLGADAANGEAVARLYAAKGRPSFNPLIAHFSDTASAAQIARFNDDAFRLAKSFWPGPLTLVLPRMPGCPVADLATAGLDTIAVRVPAHPAAHAILSAFGGPVVAPSANLSGHVSPTTAAHVMADLAGRIDLIVDGGSTPVGLESTIVDCSGKPALLRAGGIPREAIAQVLGHDLVDAAAFHHDAPRPAPGMLASHYAPRALLRLNARHVEPGEALLTFGASLPRGTESACRVMHLSERGDLIEAAANLFGHLRELDAAGASRIAVMPIPAQGLGEAINDRLSRAAAPRDNAP
jgi:L-threonylcarbamoyladenylate synthase